MAIAEDRERLACQRLINKLGDYPAIVKLHARAVGVEDARDVRFEAVRAVVRHGQCLSVSLALVIAGARTYRVYVAPIILRLGMHEGIAITLRGARQQEGCAMTASDLQHVAGS